jgi:hypothetical protein
MTAAILPPAVVKQLADLAPSFTPATYLRFIVLVMAAILTTGSRTVCNVSVRDSWGAADSARMM